MGYRLVALACLPLEGLELTHSARLVLIQMARMAKDSADEPTYYGGWKFLAEILGYPVWTPTDKSAVARAVAELIRKKIIESGGQPAPGQAVEYRLRLHL